MDPLVAAAAIGAGGNFIGSLFGMASQQQSNALSEKMFYDQLAQQQRQFDASLDWSKDQFAQQLAYNRGALNSSQIFNAGLSREMQSRQAASNMAMMEKQFKLNADYNSAASQRNRLEEAGLNPYLMMNGGSAGSASATALQTGAPAVGSGPNSAGGTSAPSAGGSGVPSLHANNGNFIGSIVDGLFQMGLRKAQMKKAQSEAENVELQNKFYQAKTIAFIDELKSRAKSNYSRALYDGAKGEILQEAHSDIVDKLHWDKMNAIQQNANMIALTAQNNLKNSYLRMKVEALPQMIKLRMNLTAGQILAAYAAAGKSKAEARLATSKAVQQETMNAGWNKTLASMYVNDLVQGIDWDNLRKRYEVNNLYKYGHLRGMREFVDLVNPFTHVPVNFNVGLGL